MNFRDALIITPALGGLRGKPLAAQERMCELGARRLELPGCSDLPLARNVLLTVAHDDDRPAVLMLDADISCDVKDARRLLDLSLEMGACSGLYGLGGGRLAAVKRWPSGWRVGLGFVGVTRARLRGLARSWHRIRVSGGVPDVYPWCLCGEGPERRWLSEDHWLCESLGGVGIADVRAVHHKPAGDLVVSDADVAALVARSHQCPPGAS